MLASDRGDWVANLAVVGHLSVLLRLRVVVALKQRWKFIKENKKTRFRPRKRSRKKKENSLSTKKAIKKKRKNNNGQEKKKENTLSTKKAIKKKR